MRVKCLAQEHNTMSLARARTRTARSGDERTNHKPPRLPHCVNNRVYLFIYLFIYLDIQVLREKQMSVSRDLEEKQTTCQQLQTSADELEVQIDTLSEERQRVSFYSYRTTQ